MSEQQAALAHSATAPAAVAARPRISADAFRNLTARLKKSEVSIPDMMPALAPVHAPVAMPAIELAPALVVETHPAPAIVNVEAFTPESINPVTVEAEFVPTLAFEPEFSQPATLALDEVIPAPSFETVDLSPVMLEPVEVADFEMPEPDVALALPVEPLVVEQFEAISILPVTPDLATVDVEQEPVSLIEAQAAELPTTAFDVAIIEPVVLDIVQDDVSFEPEAAVAEQAAAELPTAAFDVAVIEPVVLDILQADVSTETQADDQLQAMLADLPPFVENPVVMLNPAEVKPQADAALSGGFAENFTYVPEAGKDAPAVAKAGPETEASLAEIDEAVRQELAQRSTELELENIWRMLLAKPTTEDRSAYMREAAEYHAADEEWNKPAPEHDLSSIQPATLEVHSALDQNETSYAEETRVNVVTPLPQVAGQDVAELARSLLDMMAAGNASGLPQERALAADTLLRLVPRLDLKPVILLAQRLAIMDSPPHLLVTRLIRDPRPEVAGPLLEDCMHIPDKDLESLVLEGEPEKLRLIARRRRLSRAISDALITSGDPSVVLTLIRNAEAEISHDGFKSLLVLCENNPDLLAPLATRHDLSAPFAFELFWLAPAQLRRFILSRFLTDSETLTKILKITMATNLEDDAEGEAISQHSLLEALERAARGHVDVAAEELATLLQVAPATVARILSDIEGEALVVMLKAAGYPRSAMAGLLKRMQDADLPIISRNRDVAELQMMFETLSFNKARILLTYWDWAVVKLGPYAPVH